MKKEYTVAGVQIIFNAAIRRRDENTCITCGTEDTPQSSHFNEVGGSPCLRFYPPNAHTQCAFCHVHEFHNNTPLPYTRWMVKNVPQYAWMDRVRGRSIKYTQPVLEAIASYCKADRIEDLTAYIEILFSEIGVEGPESLVPVGDSDEALIETYGREK